MPSRAQQLRPGARRAVAEWTGQAKPGGRQQSWLEPAVIQTVVTGGAADGNALVTVTWRGVNIQVPYLSSYTPAVGHTVLLNVQPPAYVIVGRVIGTPPAT